MQCQLCKALLIECRPCFRRRLSMIAQREKTKTLPFPTDVLVLIQEYLLIR